MITLPEGSYPRKEMEIAQLRLTKTLTKIFGKISENIFYEHKTPYLIDEWDICPDKRSQKKEMGFLRDADALPYSIKKAESWRSQRDYNYEDLFNEHSKNYMTPLIFADVPETVSDFIERDELKSGFDTSHKHLNRIGYKEVRHMTSAEKIYVYHNFESYDVLKEDKTDVRMYPKAMLDNRIKAVIKAVMKKYCEEDVLTYLNSKFGVDLKGQSQKLGDDDVEFRHELRGVARYPSTFFQGWIDTLPNSYTKEYKRVVDKINFEYNRIKDFRGKIEAAGGTAAVLNDYIKTSVDNLIGKSINLINGSDNDKNALEFILDHRDIITYDYLYN